MPSGALAQLFIEWETLCLKNYRTNLRFWMKPSSKDDFLLLQSGDVLGEDLIHFEILLIWYWFWFLWVLSLLLLGYSSAGIPQESLGILYKIQNSTIYLSGPGEYQELGLPSQLLCCRFLSDLQYSQVATSSIVKYLTPISMLLFSLRPRFKFSVFW